MPKSRIPGLLFGTTHHNDTRLERTFRGIIYGRFPRRVVNSSNESDPESRSADSEGNLRAEQLVEKGFAGTGKIQQPQHYGLEGGDFGKAWVREGEPSHFREIDRLDRNLADWARRAGVYFGLTTMMGLSHLADATFKGAEHDVYLLKPEGRKPFVIRLTKNDMFGMPHRTPGEYLERWRLFNKVFPDAAVSFLGYTQNSRGNGVILTCQPYFEGKKREWRKVDAEFAKLGFQKLPGGEPSFRHPETSLEIHDAKPDNIIFDKAGNMMPFDVWINDPNGCYTISRQKQVYLEI